MAARRRFRWGVLALGLGVIALVAFLILHRTPAKPTPKPVTPVMVARVGLADVPVSVTALGAAQAWRSDTILAQVSGTLVSVAFKEGAPVRAGELLAQIDPAPYRAVLTQAQGALQRDRALLADARLDLSRYRTLAAQDSIAKQQVDTQAALVQQDEGVVRIDEGAVAAARVNLDRTTIRSPIAGRAGVRLVDPGNLVNASGASNSAVTASTTPSASGATGVTGSAGAAGSGPAGIVIVNQIQPIAVTFTVPQGDFQRLSDLTDRFRRPLATTALSQETGAVLGTGQLTVADNRVDPATGTVQLKARFPNSAERLWPGQFVNISVTLQTLSRVVTAPAAAINQGPQGAFVYVVGQGSKVIARPVKVAVTQGSVAVVSSGLKAGETVVVDGQMTLKPGAAVKVAPSARPAAGAPAG